MFYRLVKKIKKTSYPLYVRVLKRSPARETLDMSKNDSNKVTSLARAHKYLANLNGVIYTHKTLKYFLLLNAIMGSELEVKRQILVH